MSDIRKEDLIESICENLPRDGWQLTPQILTGVEYAVDYILTQKVLRADHVPQWQDISTAPSGKRLLVLDAWSDCWIAKQEHKVWIDLSDDQELGDITHWMQPPQPPTEKD